MSRIAAPTHLKVVSGFDLEVGAEGEILHLEGNQSPGVFCNKLVELRVAFFGWFIKKSNI